MGSYWVLVLPCFFEQPIYEKLDKEFLYLKNKMPWIKTEKQARRADDRADAPATDQERAPRARTVFVGATGALRASRSRKNLQEIRRAPDRHDGVFDRGNFEPNSQ